MYPAFATSNGPNSSPAVRASSGDIPAATSSALKYATHPPSKKLGTTQNLPINRLPTAMAVPSAAPGSTTVSSWGLSATASTFAGSNAVPVNTLNAPAVRTQPVPARNPPDTGDGSNRTMFPSLAEPSADMSAPVPKDVSAMAASTVGSFSDSSMPSVA